MTPSVEPPPDRVRTSATPSARLLPRDRWHGTAQDLLGLLGSSDTDPAHEGTISVLFRRLPCRAMLFHEGSPADALHVVRSGTFKCFRTDADGSERVLGFARRGDVLGYGALGLGRHTSTVVALEPSSVAVVPLADLFDWLQRLPALQRTLHQALSLQHARAEQMSDLRAVVPAEVRVARFLLRWSNRLAIGGESVRQLKLVMSRRDIARLLGLAHETVSRALGSLAASGCVAVTGRTVDILDPATLLATARFKIARRATPRRVAQAASLHCIATPR